MKTKTRRNPLARPAGFLTAVLIGLSAVPLQSLTAFAGEHSAANLQIGEAIYIGDTIDFGTGAYIVYDDEDPEENRKQLTGVLTLSYDAYYDGYDQYMFKLDSDSSSNQVWITAGAGNEEPDTPTCITLKSGAGTQSSPYLFGVGFTEPAKPVQVGETYKVGDYIDFGTGNYCEYNDQVSSPSALSGTYMVSSWEYSERGAQYHFVLTGNRDVSFWISSENLGTPKGFMVTGGSGTQSDPYRFDAIYNVPAKSFAVGETYKVGDYIDFGTEKYCLYDDQASSPSALSGTYMVSSWEYSEGCAQYYFVLTGNCDASLSISSENFGTPEGFMVTGGSGTQSDPYTFGFELEQPEKPVQENGVYRDGDRIDFGTGAYFVWDDDDPDERRTQLTDVWTVSYNGYYSSCHQYKFMLESGNTMQQVWISSENRGTPTGFRIIDGGGAADRPYVLGVVFAKPFAAGEIYRDGDVIDFGDGVYCKLDDQSTTVRKVSDVLKVRFDNYEEDRGQYLYALTDFEADFHDVWITSDGIGMPTGFTVTGGSGTGSNPYTFGLVFVKPLAVGKTYRVGDYINFINDFGEYAYCITAPRENQGESDFYDPDAPFCDWIVEQIRGVAKVVEYSGYDSGKYHFKLKDLKYGNSYSMQIRSENLGTPVGFTVTGGEGFDDDPFTFDVVFDTAFAKPIRMGATYKVGDTIDFGTGTYCMLDGFDDYFFSGLDSVRYDGYYQSGDENYSHGYYVFYLYKEATCDARIDITSDDLGTPLGLKITGGSGTQSDPYTFDVVFAKTVWEESIFLTGDYIDFKDGDFIIRDSDSDEECNVTLFTKELSGVWQLRYLRYFQEGRKYVFQLVSESGEVVSVCIDSEDRGTPSGIALWEGDGSYDDPYAFVAMSPVRSVEAGGVYLKGDAVNFGDGVFCKLNDQGIPTKLAGIRYVRFDEYSSGQCEFGLRGGEDTRYLHLTSENPYWPNGFRITGGSGTQSDPYTFGLVFPISATISKTEFAYTGSAVKVGNYLTVKCGDRTLTYGTDFTTSYANNKNVGYRTASVTINGKGEYAGSETLHYSIVPAKQAKPVLSMNGTALHVEWTADANAQGYDVQYCKNSSFTGSTLHKITYTDKTSCNLSQFPKVGEKWYVRVRSFISDGYGHSAGFWSDTASMTLAPAITSVTLSKTSFPYTGSAVKVGSYLTVKCGDTKLTYGTDYTTSYSANTAVGYQTATVTVKGTGKYSGTFTKKYTIYPKKQAKPALSMSGTALHVEWTADSSALGYELEYCQNSSFSSTDTSYHSVTYTGKNAVNLSKYPKIGETWYVRVRAFITNNGKTSGTKYGAWSDVASKKLEAAITNVTLSKTEFVYTGSAVKVGSYLTVKFGDKKLTYGTDYTTTYANNKNVGFETAAVTVKGTGEYSGSVTLHYSILPPKQAKPTLSMDGTALHVAWTVDASAVGYELEYCKNSSFSPTDESYHCVTYTGKTAVNLSKYPKLGETWYVRVRAFITNNGSTSGTKYGAWSDAASRKLTAAITSVTLSKTEFNYTGSAITVGSYLTVKCGDTKLTYGTDYTTTYTANKNCGVKTAKVTVKGIGKYTGTFTKTFTIVPAKQAKPTLTAVSGGFKAEWTADSNAIGYELVYCKNSSFTGDSLHSCVYTATSATLTKYPATGEKWYVKVRAVISSNGTTSGTLYGTYSAVASVTAG